MVQEKSTSTIAVPPPPAPTQAEGKKIPLPAANNSAPQPVIEIKPIVVKVFDDFAINVNGSFTQFRKGQVIADQNLAKFLLEQKCYVALVESGDYSVCPQCKHFYKT
jgi:hypothetical protein